MNPSGLLRIILLSGWLFAGFIALLIIIAIVVLAVMNRPIPQEITNFGGIIIGFFFGQFASFIKDALLPGAPGDKRDVR